jgi:exocyst complex component 4
VRFRILQTAATVLDAPYLLEQPVNEADRSVLQLNNDLLPYDEAITSHLPGIERSFLTTGLGALLDTYIVTNALSQITSMNRNGCGRMQLNLLVLQQNLKSVERDVRLARSAQLFEYFAQGPKAMVQTARDTGGEGMGFGLDEMKGLVELCYSEGLQSESREAQSQARRNMGEDTLQLTEYMWSV